MEVVRGNRKNGKLPTENPDEPFFFLEGVLPGAAPLPKSAACKGGNRRGQGVEKGGKEGLKNRTVTIHLKAGLFLLFGGE